ncbi:FecCD family ABC transporter permease [Enterococcus sp. AZ103]|uniref:FecCD family ABC transporter permease n=1 Tax=Enterococcus sp. AZ103 TaxID=2774628 RepID=UPI003F294F62
MKKKVIWILLLILLLVGAYFSLTIGTLPISSKDLYQFFSGNASYAQQLIILDFRFPRLLISILAGIGLSISGYLFQSVTHNELADPGILGINSGAGLTVLIYLSFFSSSDTSWGLPLIACLGSFVAAALIYFFGRQAHRLAPNRILIAGVAVNAGISALTLISTVRASSNSYQLVTSWLSGTIWGTTWQHVFLLLPWLLILLPIILIKGRQLEVLELGDETAIGLGIKLKRTQMTFLFCGVCLAAVSVAMAGSISFIGLIAPHIARRISGKKNNTTLLLTGFIGAVLLLFSDIIARVIVTNGELSTGIIVSIIGAPYFVFQLLRPKY